MSKHLIGILTCVAAIAIGFGVTRYFEPAPPKPPAPPPAPTAPPTPTEPPTPAGSGEVSVDDHATQITLDRARKRSVATVALQADGAPPDRVWVWVVFFVPGGDPLSTDPVEVRWPSDGGREARVEVVTPTPWVYRPGDPGAGYYARVFASAVSPEEARAGRVDTGLDGAIPVVTIEGPRTKM
jgi:hypothetical protein